MVVHKPGRHTHIVTDQDKTSWLAQTKFADIYYTISTKFVFLTAAFVNGGMVGAYIGGGVCTCNAQLVAQASSSTPSSCMGTT